MIRVNVASHFIVIYRRGCVLRIQLELVVASCVCLGEDEPHGKDRDQRPSSVPTNVRKAGMAIEVCLDCKAKFTCIDRCLSAEHAVRCRWESSIVQKK